MTYQTILYEVRNRVAYVMLNRPRYRNAQSRLMLEEMDAAFAVADADSDVGVILLSGTGEHFSAGHDLGTPDERADAEARPIEEGIRGRYERSHELFVNFGHRWRNLAKPSIAAVHGYCIFGGWMIASSMDIIYAARDAMFLGSNFQYFTVPWDMHPRKAKELLFESRFVDGEEACELELVNRAFPAEALMDEAIAWAERVAQNDPFQLRMIKLAVNQAQDAQGFQGHINAAHAYHLLSATGESDPGFALRKVGKRRPMVQKAHENYALRKQADSKPHSE